MLPSDDCDECRPSYLPRSFVTTSLPTLAISTLPFTLTWVATVILAKRRLFPLLSPERVENRTVEVLPQFNKDGFRPLTRRRFRGPSVQKLASWVFSVSLGLSTVLVELLLCEISNTMDPVARGSAMRLTLTSSLILSVLITPAIEIHGLAKLLMGSSDDQTSTRRRRPRLQFLVAGVLFSAWLLTFWYIPQISILRTRLNYQASLERGRPFTEACLERVGIIGISLMASLSGFAAVSSLWQTFGVKHRVVSESDISRKESGLSATSEMLAAKQSRLRALQRKMSESASSSERPGFVGRMIGSLRSGSSETQELKALEMEVSGLEAMHYDLSSTVATLRSRRADQQHSHTVVGRVFKIFNTAFALYCAYRIFATSLSSLRRWWQPDHSFATSDPVNNVLAILTTHWDSNLDREAWSRQFSFLLSGAMLFASFSAVLQTFRLFARFAPSMIRHAQTSLPLIIAQIAGAYVISSALLLRSNLPPEVRTVISDALGAPLEGKFVESWFENWFLVAVGLTATGILVGRKIGGGDDWDDYDDGFGSGGHKRS